MLQGLIRLLSTCASGSLLGAKTLLLLGISGILKDILSVSGLSVSPALTRPSEQVRVGSFIIDFFCIMKLLNYGFHQPYLYVEVFKTS